MRTSDLTSISPAGAPSTVSSLAALRRRSDLALDVFRLLVVALSRPGRVVTLPATPDGLHPVHLPVLALADLQTTLVVDGGAEYGVDISLLQRITSARPAAIGDADLVVVAGGAFTPVLVDELRRGTAADPERGAKVFVACDAVGDPPGATEVWVEGPGARPGRLVAVRGVAADAVAALDRRNDAYPAGIDCTFVDRRGALVSLPRSSRLEVRSEAR